MCVSRLQWRTIWIIFVRVYFIFWICYYTCNTDYDKPFQSSMATYNSPVCASYSNVCGHYRCTGSSRTLPRVHYSADDLYALRPRLGQSFMDHNKRVFIDSLGIKYRHRGSRGKFSRSRYMEHCKRDRTRQYEANYGVHHVLLRPLKRKTEFHAHEIKLSVATVNVQSFGSKFDAFIDFLCEFKLDIIAVTESWIKCLSEHQKSELNMCSMDADILPRKGRIGGGVALVYNSDLAVKRIKKVCSSSMELGLWSVSTGNTTLHVVALYRPPSSLVKDFLDEFSDVVSDLLANYNNCVLMGDFNIHYNKHDDPNCVAFRDILDSFDLIQVVTCPTHRLGNTLDFIVLENNSTLVCADDPKDLFYISDHSFVVTTLNVSRPQPKQETVIFRKIKAIPSELLRGDLEKLFDAGKLPDDLHSLVQYYDKTLASLLDKYAPLVTKKITSKRVVPWFDDTAKTMKADRRRLEKVWKRTRLQEDWVNFRVCCSIYLKHLYMCKVECYQSKIEECGNDSKKIYNTINGLINTTSSNPLPDEPPDLLANSFADYFYNKIKKICDELDQCELYTPSLKDVPSMKTFQPVTETFVAKLLSEMKPTTCASDPCPSVIIKSNKDLLTTVITKIINLSLGTSTFDESWKQATVLPLLKKSGLDRVYSNYRPVSNLPYLSKLVEKSALSQLNQHFSEHALLPDYQSAYRASYSTETALVRLHHDILHRMERQQITSFIALDLSAAFDTVNHEVLLQVLDARFGVKDEVLKWADSYLRPRSFSVQVPGCTSARREIPFSVPQGSCLGPVLFSTYSSTLEDVIPQDIGVRGYADDHGLDIAFTPTTVDEERACASLELCCDNIIKWMHMNRLKINTSKTEFVYFGGARQMDKCALHQITVGDSVVTRSTNVKYLGVKLDQNLTLKEQVSSKCGLAMANIKKVRSIRNYISVALCNQIVVALVLSHLDYANALYNGLPKCTLTKLQRIQNVAAKLVLGRKQQDSSRQSLADVHWLPVKYRIMYKICMLVYKCLTGNAPNYLKSLISVKVYRPGLRAESQGPFLDPPKVKHETFLKRSFAYSGPLYWNKLPLEIRTSSSEIHFKNLLKTHLFSEALSGS